MSKTESVRFLKASQVVVNRNVAAVVIGLLFGFAVCWPYNYYNLGEKLKKENQDFAECIIASNSIRAKTLEVRAQEMIEHIIELELGGC